MLKLQDLLKSPTDAPAHASQDSQINTISLQQPNRGLKMARNLCMNELNE